MKMRTSKWELCRSEKVPIFGSKDSSTDKDRLDLFAVYLRSGTLANAEYLNYFQSIVMNCGSGSEIGLLRCNHLKMRSIKEDCGVQFDTLTLYVNQVKMLG